MIKRRFYREEHGDKDEQSSNSSSSSSSDSEVEAEDAVESEDHSEGGEELKEIVESPSSSSGYESDNSSAADEINADSTDDESESDKQNAVSLQLSGKHGAGARKGEINGLAEKESLPDEMPDFVLKIKSVYKCQLCPQVVCLTEQTMRTHLSSKKHARKEKLLKENRLTTQLNIYGEIENQETPADMNARIVALGKNQSKKNKGRQRQKNRLRKKKDVPNIEKAKESTKRPAKKEPTKRPAKKRRKDES